MVGISRTDLLKAEKRGIKIENAFIYNLSRVKIFQIVNMDIR